MDSLLVNPLAHGAQKVLHPDFAHVDQDDGVEEEQEEPGRHHSIGDELGHGGVAGVCVGRQPDESTRGDGQHGKQC